MRSVPLMTSLAEATGSTAAKFATWEDACTVVPLDITDLFAVEVDFEEDLTRANRRH